MKVLLDSMFNIWNIWKKIHIPKKKKETYSWVSKEHFDKAYDFHIHADKIYHQRFNFFLVAESMLVVSYVTSLTASSTDTNIKIIGMGICTLGLIFTLIWLYVNARLEYRVCYMIEHFLINDEIYREYIRCVGGKFSKIFLVYILPVSMTILWILFLFSSFPNEQLFLIILTSSILLFLFSAWLNYFLLPKHSFLKFSYLGINKYYRLVSQFKNNHR